MAERILLNEFKSLVKEKWVNIEVRSLFRPLYILSQTLIFSSFTQLNNEDIFDWNVALIILNPDSLYYGGYFKANMTFPSNYPFSPPRESLSLLMIIPSFTPVAFIRVQNRSEDGEQLHLTFFEYTETNHA